MALSRGANFLVTFMLIAVVVSITAVLATYFLVGRGPTVESNSVLWLRIPDNLTEHEPNYFLGQLLTGRRDTVGSVVEALRKAKVDNRISAVVVMPGQQALWGKVQEIRDAILDFRESGKVAVAYLEYGGGQPYYLATACDQIYLTPTSPLDLVGVTTYGLFLRDALDKVGIYPDMLRAGDYKTASNLYTENTFTPEHREMIEALNRDLYEQLVEGIAQSRKMTTSDVRAVIDEGPLLPDEAVEHGLIDALLYDDELEAELLVNGDELQRLEYSDYRQVEPRSLGLNRGPTIAVVYGVGTITFGQGGADVTGSDVMGSETMVEAIRDAREDDSVRAIVFRIDSPGGVAIASDIIWRELALAAEDKPLIASMSDVAASGGYYIAAPTHLIVAQPATLTGSIGVVGGKLVIGGTLEKLGVNIEGVSDGQHADLNSPVTPFSDEGRAKIQNQIDTIYARFLDVAAKGRGMTPEAVHEVGQGRIWTGQQAKDLGLVDELGGLGRAVELAKMAAGIDKDSEVRIIYYPRPRSFLKQLRSSPFIQTADARAAFVDTPYGRLWAAATISLRLFRMGQPLVLMPFTHVQ